MFNCDETAAYAASSLAFRDRLITQWNRTQQRQTFADGKRVYYLSLEFLMGRALDNAMLNVGMKDVARGNPPFLTFYRSNSNEVSSRRSQRPRFPHRRHH
jgi:starch phosphorylase